MPDSILPDQQPVNTMRCDSFVVVSFWQPKSGSSEGDYDYETHATLNEALDAYRELEDGEYPRARAIGIFAARYGMPVGSRIEPAVILRLLKETRAA